MSLILLEASTGIEPVWTDLQSAASPLRQLAAVFGSFKPRPRGRQGSECVQNGLLRHAGPFALGDYVLLIGFDYCRPRYFV